MRQPEALQQALSELLGDARLVAETLPGTDIALWLIDGGYATLQFTLYGLVFGLMG